MTFFFLTLSSFLVQCCFALFSPKHFFSFFKNLFILFIYFWLRWVFVVVRGLLVAVAFLVAEHGL